jgi:uncharacterized iron-regulated membrane protein
MVKPGRTMRALVLLHRWLGVSFCLLFAMWFATGMVMHFVPFPALSETERIGGLRSLDASQALRGPAAAVHASGIEDATRVRLLQRGDGPVYVVTGASGASAVRADDLANAAVKSAPSALQIAAETARQRGLDASQAAVAGLANYDQWTVPNGFDRHRPLYRIALNDNAGTELYVSRVTGEVVLDTTRRERAWNYVGSVTHWIYPTVLRRSHAAWDATVWSLSLVALIAAISGSVLGMSKLKIGRRRITSPYAGWHKWHHVLGLTCMSFVLSWIFSGWLSMDHGRLFATGKLTGAEAAAIAGAPWRDAISRGETRPISAQAKEVEWLVFNREFYRRERTGLDTQLLFSGASDAGDPPPPREFLSSKEVAALVERLAPNCDAPFTVAADDNYAVSPSMPTAPVYRSVCGEVWFHIDGASGAILERLDRSRRAYRWFYSALHTMDIPVLAAHPTLRSALIVTLCGCGFAFSLTGVVIGWRRLRLQVSA